MKNYKHTINLQYYHSPCGELVLASVGEELCLCDWKDNPCAERNICRLVSSLNAELKIETSHVSNETRRQLEEYFAGNPRRSASRCIPWVLTSSYRYGKPYSIFHMELQGVTSK